MAGPGLLLYCCSAILSVSHSPPWCAAPFVKILPVFHTASYAQIKTGGSSAMRKKGRTVFEDSWQSLLQISQTVVNPSNVVHIFQASFHLRPPISLYIQAHISKQRSL